MLIFLNEVLGNLVCTKIDKFSFIIFFKQDWLIDIMAKSL